MSSKSEPTSPSQHVPSQPHDSPPPESSKTKAAVWVPILLSVAVAIGSLFGWVYERHSQSERQLNEQRIAEVKENTAKLKESQRLSDEYLVKLQAALVKNKYISDELHAEYLEPGWGILESYVIKARRDGHDKHALMYQRISRLVRQNSEILSLLEGYAPHALTPDFKKQAEDFTDHAQRYIDRWEVVPKAVETKLQLPVAKVFPPGFPAAVMGEMDARRAQSVSRP